MKEYGVFFSPKKVFFLGKMEIYVCGPCLCTQGTVHRSDCLTCVTLLFTNSYEFSSINIFSIYEFAFDQDLLDHKTAAATVVAMVAVKKYMPILAT